MTAPTVLALDLGTTSTRALVVDAAGQVLARASRPLRQHYPEPGWLEQDPQEFLESSVAVMREALTAAGLEARALRGLGIVSQRSTAIAWDAKTGQPLAPAIGWQDRRNQARVDELVALGIPINTLASATKFEWMLKHLPPVQQAAKEGRLRLGTPDAWLSDRLCAEGGFVTDPSHAACTGLLEQGTRQWWDPVIGLFGVSAEQLPTVVATSEVVGETASEWLGGPVAVAARAGDQQAACFAQGILEPGMAKLTLGTSAMLNLHLEPGAEANFPGFHILPLWDLPGRERAHCVEGTVITAGSAVEWLCELGLLGEASQLDSLATSVDDSGGVMFVPAFQGLGSPILDVEARALAIGLTRGTGRGHLARALVEGIAQRCVDLCDALPLTEEPLRVDGGLARSESLVQTIADLLGRPLWRAREPETTSLGAAYLAGLATGMWQSPDAALATLEAPHRVEPAWGAARREKARERWAGALERARSRA